MRTRLLLLHSCFAVVLLFTSAVAALTDCSLLNYLRTANGLPVTINTNFARPTANQLPLSVRFGLEMTF